jgi:hypothetical protein
MPYPKGRIRVRDDRGEGWSHRFRPGAKGPLGLTEKNFQWEKYFSLAVFWGDRRSQLRQAERTKTNNHGFLPPGRTPQNAS